MGQYFYIVNIDKKEFLAPDVFGDGSKLDELSSAGSGVLQALALLTATGNGAGNGDIERTAHDSQPELFEPKTGEKIYLEWAVTSDHNNVVHPEGEMHLARIFVPVVTGRWAGDRIVTAGDYTPPNIYLTKAEQLRGAARKFDQDTESARLRINTRPVEVRSINLYEACDLLFEDISDTVQEQLALFGFGRFSTDAHIEERVRRFLTQRLLYEFSHMQIIGKGRAAKRKWKLDWMIPEIFDSFMLSCNSPAELKLAKAWLRKQLLTPEQKHMLKYYTSHGGRVDRTRSFTEIREEATASETKGLGRIRAYPPILPSAKYLAAAIDVEQQADAAKITTTADGLDIAQKLGLRTRERVIELDK